MGEAVRIDLTKPPRDPSIAGFEVTGKGEPLAQRLRTLFKRKSHWVVLLWVFYVSVWMGWTVYESPVLTDICKGLL